MLPTGWTEAALPAAVRAALADAREGVGPLRAWVAARGDTSSTVNVAADETCDREVAGWIAGIAMANDHHRAISNAILQRGLLAVIPGVLAAFATSVLLNVPMPRKQWRTIEQLALRCDRIPPELVEVLPLGLCHTFPMIRDVAQRLAVLAGGAGLAVVESALAGATEAARDGKSAQARAHERWLREAREAFVRPRATSEVRVDELLARLLEAWRATRDPALEGPIGELGARAAYLRGPVATADPDNAWLALARLGDASDLDRLLDATWSVSEHALVARLAALAGRPADPRLARLIDVAATRSTWTPEMHTRAADFLVPRATAGMARSLARLVGPDAPRYDDVVHAVDQLPLHGTAPPELLAEAGEVLAPIRALEDLWRQHDADPSDLQLRAVLADALVADGDPRGELIALQLAIAAGTADDAAQRRAQRLLAEHAAAWDHVPGTLVPHGTAYQRGFAVVASTPLAAEDVRHTLHRRAWVALERLELTTSGGLDLTPLVRRAPLLHTLIASTVAQLETLVASGPYPQLRTLGCVERWVPPEGAFPNLTTYQSHLAGDIAHQYRQLVRLGVTTFHHQAYPAEWGAHGAARSYGPARVILGRTGWRVAVPARGNTLDMELPTASMFYVPSILDPLVELVRYGIARVRLHIPGNAAPSASVVEIVEALASRDVRVEPGAPPLEKLGFV